MVGAFSGTVKPGSPVEFDTAISVSKSSWISDRRMDDIGHKTHTAPVYIYVKARTVYENILKGATE